MEETKRKAGRRKGSKNKVKPAATPVTPEVVPADLFVISATSSEVGEVVETPPKRVRPVKPRTPSTSSEEEVEPPPPKVRKVRKAKAKPKRPPSPSSSESSEAPPPRRRKRVARPLPESSEDEVPAPTPYHFSTIYDALYADVRR